MEKRLIRIAFVLTYLLIGALLFTVFLFVSGCSDSDDKKLNDPRNALFDSLKGSWVLESVELDDQALQGFDEFSITFEETSSPFLYQYRCTNRPELSPWKAEGTWEFGNNVEMEMTRDQGSEDEVNIVYVLDEDQLTIRFTFTGEGYNARLKSASGDWVFVLIKQ